MPSLSMHIWSAKRIIFLLLIAVITACATVPGTGRSQLSLVGDSELNAMAASQYKEIIKTGPLSSNAAETARIKKVGARIAKAAEQYLKEHGLANEINNYHWEFNLIESKDANAFCMPGGKVVFYTGILAYTKNEAGIAVIMGHEVAHAIAHHSRERASQQMMTQLGGTMLSLGLGLGEASALTQDMAMAAYGLGSEVGILLPYSRAHESEADRIGLSLMAMAGYNPEEAIAFWQRMAAAESGKSNTLTSTHPSDQQRIANIKKYMPEALSRYQKR